MITRRSWAVYGMLMAVWALLLGWQIAEHMRAQQSFQNMVVDRGRYITTTCGLLMRGSRYFGVVSQERLEAALNQLVNTNELRSVKLLNTNGEAVASAGVPFELPPRDELKGGVLWGDNTVIVESTGTGPADSFSCSVACAPIVPSGSRTGFIAVISPIR